MRWLVSNLLGTPPRLSRQDPEGPRFPTSQDAADDSGAMIRVGGRLSPWKQALWCRSEMANSLLQAVCRVGVIFICRLDLDRRGKLILPYDLSKFESAIYAPESGDCGRFPDVGR